MSGQFRPIFKGSKKDLYVNPLSTLMSSLSLNHHLYANDTQLFLIPSSYMWLK